MESVHLQLPAALLARVDEAAGDVPRNRWIRRAIEQALGDHPLPVFGGFPVVTDERVPRGKVGVVSPHQPGPNVENIRSSAQVKGDIKPIPKGGKS